MRAANRMKSWNLKKKIGFFLSLAIMATSVMILVVSTISAAYYMTKQSKDMATEQMETIASNYADTFAQYHTLAVSIVINDEVQRYCKNTDHFGHEYENAAGEAYNYLLNMLNVQGNMNFAVIMREGTGDYVYKGNTSIVDARFDLAYRDDYEASTPVKEGSTVRISCGNRYFRNHQYTLTLYHPVYSTASIMEPIGMLVMNLSDSMLKSLHDGGSQEDSSELFLVGQGGEILAVADEEKMGEKVSYRDALTGDKGSFRDQGFLINYQRVGNWNYYLINETPILELYRGSIVTMVLLLMVILITTVISLVLLRRMMNAFYEPINRVVLVMDDVADGRLDVRIDMKSMDIDSQKLAEGFNLMMDKIDVLMEQVKEEQHQIEQIRFNGLYSQIKPHFLYNTLECIHWQAVRDGNKEVSTMVKAMAQYYRICLSRGKEIIALREELTHIRSYLIIQNMRYNNIITLADHISAEYYNVKIPKMTLQPLVENAIYHGIRVKDGEKGTIDLSVRREDEDIYILVEDSGTGMPQKEIDEMNQSISEYDETFGYGVRNVNKRIELMFGTEYGLKFFRNTHGGVTVEIHLPQHITESREI